MKRLLTKGLAVVLAGCGFFSEFGTAKAAPLPFSSIDYSTDAVLGGSTWTNLQNGSSASLFQGPTSFGGVSFTFITLSSNNTGTPSNAFVATNTFIVTGTGHFFLGFSSKNFSLPTAPPTISETVSATSNGVSGSATVSVRSWADQGDRIIPVGPDGGPYAANAGINPLTPGNLAGPVSTGLVVFNGSNSGTTGVGTTLIPALNSPYAIDVLLEVDVTNVTALQITASTNLNVLDTPEPATIVLVGFGAVGMAGYSWRRRKLMA